MSDTGNDQTPFLAGFADLDRLWTQLDAFEAEIETLSQQRQDVVAEPLARTAQKLQAFEPSVSIIGQIKAGKSTLVNAMIGQPDLLPSDVNPWTSVVTGVHLNSRTRPPNTKALFRFFDEHEWDRLAETGGRLGEMAQRAGLADEADEVRRQVADMRASTEARLGDDFTEILGRSVVYEEFDKALLDRFICYGDPDDVENGSEDGAYADLTKSADLYLDLPGYPRGLCFRDTPGVNDTFMMREQITLNAISESRVCVVVLSAHQALSTMDLAILRIICSIEAREVVLFVNRIDELRDPLKQVEDIRQSITKTLGKLDLGREVEILFGSGHWANLAQTGRADTLRAEAWSKVEALCAAKGVAREDPAHLAFAASGIGDLHRAIARRVVEGPGAALQRDLRHELDQIVAMSNTVLSMSEAVADRIAPEHRADILAKVHALRSQTLTAYDAKIFELRSTLHERLNRAQTTFVQSAVDALQSHIEAFGEMDTWQREPTGLRVMMRSAYGNVITKLNREASHAIEDAFSGFQDILQYDLEIYSDSNLDVYAVNNTLPQPEPPRLAPPMILARTLSLDLQKSWWRKFWLFRGKVAAAERYRQHIAAEVAPLVAGLLASHFDPAADAVREQIETYCTDQERLITVILGGLAEDVPATKAVRSAA